MYFVRSIALAVLSISLATAAGMSADAQEKPHAAFIANVRRAVKNPTEYHELYNLVIQPEFAQTAREAAQAGNDALVVELLQSYSGQTSDKEKGGTALLWASYYCDAPLLEILLNRGLDVNAQDGEGDAPLHRAMGIGRADIVKMLLEAGARVNVANYEGVTPLMMTAGDNTTVNTRAFLEWGAEVDAQNKKGETALMLSAQSGRVENVRILLAAGANARPKNRQGETALQMAAKSAGAPSTDPYDTSEFLTNERADKLAAKAKRDKAEIIQLLKRASGQ